MEQIQIRNLWKSFHEELVIKDFCFDLIPNEIVCFFGPSGCGKTTFFRILAGLEKPDSGKIIGLAGKKVSCVFQEDRLLPWKSARDNILAVNPDENRCQWLMEKIGLKKEGGKYPADMSGGMKRRIAIARALAYGGELLLLDEPFRGLDKKRKQEMMELVQEEAQGKYCVLITHEKEEALFLANKIWKVAGPPLSIEGVFVS